MVSVSNQKICEIDIRIFLPLFEMREKNSGLVFVVHLRENCEKTWHQHDISIIAEERYLGGYIIFFKYLQFSVR